MAPPSPGRKGWRQLLRVAGILIIAAVIALPVSFMTAMAMTPLLYRLEPKLGMELAGHSGPSDWIFALIFGITTVLLFAAIVWVTRSAPTIPGEQSGRINTG